MNTSDIVFLVTFPLWIGSLLVFLPLTEGAGLLVNLACVVITMSLLALNAAGYFQMFNREEKKEPREKSLDKAVDTLFNKLKKAERSDKDGAN